VTSSSAAPADPGTPEGRLVHLGVGNFSRAHTLLYTDRAGGWQVAVFTGRSPELADVLTAQDGRYGLVVRGPEADEVELMDVIDEVHPGSDVDALCALLADPLTAVVTLTITEKGYFAGDDPATSVPARLALALRARREAGVQEPIALVSCDNLPGNGAVLGEAVRKAADAETVAWMDEHVDVISTMVDRITPAAGPAEAETVRATTGFDDHAPVVTEPFHEWVLQDRFRGRRPAWERFGAVFTDDLELHERRKLRLLNGAHSFMAYAGQLAGHERVDQAISDPAIRALVEDVWADARATLPLPDAELDAYTSALVERFENPRMADALARIAQDGSVKLRVRALPVIAERGRPTEAPGEVRMVAAWTAFVTSRVAAGLEVDDPRSAPIAQAAALSDPRERVGGLVALLFDGGAEDPDLDPGLADAVLAAEADLPRA
jgi:fructuronate reductase